MQIDAIQAGMKDKDGRLFSTYPPSFLQMSFREQAHCLEVMFKDFHTAKMSTTTGQRRPNPNGKRGCVPVPGQNSFQSRDVNTANFTVGSIEQFKSRTQSIMRDMIRYFGYRVLAKKPPYVIGSYELNMENYRDGLPDSVLLNGENFSFETHPVFLKVLNAYHKCALASANSGTSTQQQKPDPLTDHQLRTILKHPLCSRWTPAVSLLACLAYHLPCMPACKFLMIIFVCYFSCRA